MKKFFPIIALTFIVLPLISKSQYINIPDPALRDYFVQRYPSCVNAGQDLDTTCSEVLNATLFEIGGTVNNWQGFQYLRSLKDVHIMEDMGTYPVLPATLENLVIYGNTLTASNFPTLPPGLKTLDVQSGYLTQLPALPASLTHLRVFGAYMTTFNVPVLPAGLTSLKLQMCGITSGLPYPLPAGIDTLDVSDNGLHYQFPGLPPGLKYFNCNNNGYITSLGPLLPATLKYLDCGGNEGLTSLPALPVQLEYLNAYACAITSLPALPASLKDLEVGANQLTSLPSLPSYLTKLACGANLLTSLPALSDSLRWFECSYNQLTNVPTLPTRLNTFLCSNNQLTSLPALPASLNYVECSDNQLTSLPTLPGSFWGYLYCQNNLLTSLPTLPANVRGIHCYNNQLTSLPTLPPLLEQLVCYNNQLTCLPYLPATLQDVYMDSTIKCVPNYPTDCFFEGFPYAWNIPVCSPVNNVNHCQVFPTVTGIVYNDNNSNNVRDANEPVRANIRLTSSNGKITFTDDNGQYAFWADTLGAFNVNCNSSIYFWPAPNNNNYIFSSYDTMVVSNYAMQPTATVDSLTIVVDPLTWAARPGFPYSFLVSYENSGTTSLAPNISLNYDNTRLIFDSVSNASINNTGSSLQLTQSMVAGERGSFTAYFRIKPTAVLGDTLFTNAHATIAGNGVDAYDSIYARIRGSYDPNEKIATPQMSRGDIIAGKYINYTIGFQNTGTDTAFNVVVTDTLDNTLLDVTSLKVLSSSHTCKVTQAGKIVYFEFTNIMLPDSNINEIKSHGFVHFRIRPRSFVGNGTTIYNKAAIYFDYNSPVITNTAITQIMNPTGPLPLQLVSFNVIKQTKNTANVYWTTMNEMNVQGFIIETSPDGRNYTGIAAQNAKGGSYNNYAMPVSIPAGDVVYFRLKMMDMDGRAVCSEVVLLKNSKPVDAFSFQQNPVTDVLSISIQDESLKNTTARIINSQGNILKVVMLQGDVVNINTKGLASGTYILQTIKGSSRFIVRH